MHELRSLREDVMQVTRLQSHKDYQGKVVLAKVLGGSSQIRGPVRETTPLHFVVRCDVTGVAMKCPWSSLIAVLDI